MRETQPAATIGTRNLTVIARWWVKTRSNNGAVTMAATMPERRRVAPINPLVSAEYPTGACDQ
jgi:hypothetical protein